MNDINDFIDEFLGLEKPERDSSGRPLLLGRNGERAAYTRASSLGDILEEFSFLWKWKMRGLAKGLADRMDLVRLVAAEDYTCGFAENEAANKSAGKRIDEVIERAMDHAGVSMKADYGTAIHSRTEPGNSGTDPDEKQRLDVASCWELWSLLGVTHLGTEIFTACDETMSAGTFDHLSYVPGYGIIVTDKKTSAKAKRTYDVQLSSYAHSDVYDPNTDQRQTLEEYVAAAGWDPTLINRDVGLIWWVKDGRTQARFLDLRKGFEWAQIAADIRDNRRPYAARVAPDVTKQVATWAEDDRNTLLTQIRNASSEAELVALWEEKTYRSIWDDRHTKAATERKAELP